MARFHVEQSQNGSSNGAKIKVIGTGGGGGNAVNTMIEKGLREVEFVSVNTDSQDLEKSMASTKIQIGKDISRGLGSGGNPQVARESAMEDHDTIAEALEGADMVFITAGMGGGTGTGASPVIAQACKEKNILSVAIVTKPFEFEGTARMENAAYGIGELNRYVDTLIVIPNDKLASIHKISILNAFRKADEVLYQAVKGISDIVTGTGYINVDFADVKSVMANHGGKALMSTGFAQGPNRATQAAQMAITSPLLEDVSIAGAKGILLNVTASEDFGIDELNEACRHVRERANNDIDIVFGLVFDDKAKDFVRITVVATGIENYIEKRADDMISDPQHGETSGEDLDIPTFVRRRKMVATP